MAKLTMARAGRPVKILVSAVCLAPSLSNAARCIGLVNDVITTQIYTHVLGQHYAGTESPLDKLNLAII